MTLGEAVRRARHFLAEDLWNRDFDPGTAGGRAVRFLQFAAIVARGFVRDHLLLRASALTYFTVLSLVPLLAVAISIVGSIGVGSEKFAEFLVSQVAAGAPAAQQKILDLVSQADFRGLGTVGAAFLFLTTVLAISNIETSLNQVWGVTKERSLVRRLSDYLAVLVVAPLLLGVGISLAGSMQSQWVVQQMLEKPWFAQLYDLGLRQMPLVVLAIAFAFLNWFLPNTRVNFWSALLGGTIAAVLVVTAQRFYIDFSVGVARANAVFGGFAALPLLLVWIYLFWSIFLFGAEIAFAHQNLALYRREVRGPKLGAAEREAVGLRVALEIARAFRRGEAPWNADRLSDAMSVPVRTVRDVISHLDDAGILSAVGVEGRGEGWQLARPAAAITVIDVLAALRGARHPVEGSSSLAEAAETLLSDMRQGARRAAGNRTLEDVLGHLDGPVRAAQDSGDVGSGQ